MRVEVLISTMHKTNIDFIKKMNLKSDVVIGNQADTEDVLDTELNGHNVKMITTKTRGLSNNRNITLDHASADICLFTDDDLVYEDNYVDIVTKAFEENPKADLIIFNVREEPVVRYVIPKKQKVGFLNYMRFGSVRIAFKLDSIKKHNIRLDPNFGTGSATPFGEDTIFLHDCLSAGLKVIALPITLLTLTNERESTWFKGYSEDYFHWKGRLFRRINKRMHAFLCFQDAFRHRKEYGMSWKKAYKLERSK